MLLSLAFFISGAAGLAYELCWVRYLVQLFGATTPAVSATVAVFFVGLALGSHLGGRLLSRARRPFRVYAAIEVAIGASAACVPLLFQAAEWALSRRPAADPAGTPLLLGLSALILIVPTTLLGATFPAMATAVRDLGAPTGTTGRFYGLNTLGAVAGCLLVTFCLLPGLGQARASWVMALGNGLVAVLLLVAEVRPRGTPDAPADPAHEPALAATPLPDALALLLAAATGFLGIAVEVLWTRALALSFIGSVYVFGLILCAYLCGIALGSLITGRAHQRRAPRPETLIGLLLCATIGGLLTLALLPQLPHWTLLGLMAGRFPSWAAYLGWLGGAAIVALLPATVAMGAVLPLLVGLSARGPADLGRTAGRLYAVNTLAGVAGSLTATFALMPALGLSRSLHLLTMGYAALGLLVALRLEVRRGLRRGLAAIVTVGVLAGAADLGTEVNYLKDLPGRRLLHYRDDAAGTLEVSEDPRGVRTLRLNNHYGLSHTEPETVAMQYVLGHTPLLLHGAPERALLVGFATGTTLAAMAAHPLVELECVELHGSIFDVAPHFSPANHDVWRDARVRLVEDDGRRYLSRGGPTYDVIVGDLYLPTLPGVGALYSQEHFAAARRRLRPGGLMVAWLPLFQLAPAEVATIARTFLSVFPEAEAWVGWWQPGSAILGLVGAVGPGGPRGAELGARFTPHLDASLRRGLGGGAVEPVAPPALLLDAAALRALAGHGPLERLDHPRVEMAAPRSIFLERLRREPLAEQNIRRIAQLRSLQGTPWQALGR